jgi:hypothetical protein
VETLLHLLVPVETELHRIRQIRSDFEERGLEASTLTTRPSALRSTSWTVAFVIVKLAVVYGTVVLPSTAAGPSVALIVHHAWPDVGSLVSSRGEPRQWLLSLAYAAFLATP